MLTMILGCHNGRPFFSLEMATVLARRIVRRFGEDRITAKIEEP